jgi:NAD(P)-dependent dehydrogenase (short-subunit alcohol dehydrogenase family)
LIVQTMVREFPDGVALVAGGSGGVGRAICERLARAGTPVALTYRHNRAAADEVAHAVAALGVAATTYALALDDGAAVGPLVERVAAECGPIHTVVYAVGSAIRMRFIGQVDAAEWDVVMRADAGGFFHLAQAALPHLRRTHGSLVALTSAGLMRYPSRDILSVAPKAAIEALVRGIAREEGRYGVRANSVALGVIDAGIFRRLAGAELPPQWIEAARKNTPLGRLGSADEAAEATVFLASSRAGFITGQTLVVDGGYSV